MSGRFLAVFAFAWLTALSRGQEPRALPAPPTDAEAPQEPTLPSTGEEARKNSMNACLMPADVIRLQDYAGPLHTIVTRFTGRVERRTFYSPHYRTGTVLCSLTFSGKLRLFAQDLIDPGYYVPLAFNTGIDQWQNNNPTFGRGGKAYLHRYAANFGSQASSDFIASVIFPTLFREDPRYYRLARGSGKKRLLHAVGHIILAHNDNGNRMLNYSEWLGASSSIVVNTLYHPGALHGFRSGALQGVGIFANDIGFDILREFWPEIARKLKMPFRPVQGLPTPATRP